MVNRHHTTGYRMRGRLQAGLIIWIALLLALTGSEPSWAQRKVRDNGLRNRTSDEIERRVAEISLKLYELNELVYQAEALANLSQRALSVRDIAGATDVVLQTGDLLGYSAPGLARRFGAVLAAELPEDAVAEAEATADVLLDTYEGLLVALQTQMRTLETSVQAIEDLRSQVVEDANTHVKALQLQVAAELMKAEEVLLLRQTLSVQANAQALMGAYAAQQEAHNVGLTHALLTGRWGD